MLENTIFQLTVKSLFRITWLPQEKRAENELAVPSSGFKKRARLCADRR